MTHSTVTPFRGVIVIGMPGAGTATLTTLLRGHPEVLNTPYGVFATDWYRALDPVSALVDACDELAAGDELVVALRERIRGPLDLVTATNHLFAVINELGSCKARIWAERTSRHFGHVPVLMRDFGPATRAVAVVRDPRAMLAAVVGQSPKPPTVRDAEAFCRRWITADRLITHYARRFSTDLMVVRHEDLADDTAYAMRRVCKHVGIHWGDALAGQQPAVIPATPSWSDVLMPEVVARIEQFAGHRLERWGYARTTHASGALGIRRVAFEALCLSRELRARRAWNGSGQAEFELGE